MPWLLVLALLGGCPGELKDPDRFGVAPRPDAGTGTDSGGQDASADTGGGDDGGTVECGDTFTDVVQVKCGGSSACHGSGTATGFDVDATDLATSLVGVESARCTGEFFVDSNDVSNSFILKVLQPGAPCGVLQMPVGGTLTADELTCVGQWLESLAGGGS